ncbi:MAG: DUF4160 domain-containing protein [Clostridia bacterium]|nr:DUF4160 domain-containing protein [Clostridia bacterium]
MLVLSKFHGISVMMYEGGKDFYSTPHVHVTDDGHFGVVSLSGILLCGTDLSPDEVTCARKWISLHYAELNMMWETQDFVKLPSLV